MDLSHSGKHRMLIFVHSQHDKDGKPFGAFRNMVFLSLLSSMYNVAPFEYLGTQSIVSFREAISCTKTRMAVYLHCVVAIYKLASG